MNEETYNPRKIRELKNLRERLIVKLKVADTASQRVLICIKIIDEACKKNNGLPW